MLTPEKGDEFEKHPLHCASRGRENYLFCLVIVFIFGGLEGAKRYGVYSHHTWGGAKKKENFYGGPSQTT